MKLKFENLGAIGSAEIELADLTVICGENNTGKTYVTYLIYCLLANLKKFVDVDLEEEFSALRRNGLIIIDLQEKIAERWEDICSAALKKFVAEFPGMLASKRELFAKLVLAIDMPLGLAWKKQSFQSELRSADGNLLLTMAKPGDCAEIELAAPQSEKMSTQSTASLGGFIKERLFGLMLEEAIPSVFIASTERTGATIFQNQLNLASSNLFDLLGRAEDAGSGSGRQGPLFDTISVRPSYALPIRHNVRFINQLPNSSVEEGELFKAAPVLLKRFESIVGGSYVTNKEGVTHFQPTGSDIKLGLGEVSSSVRSLLIVWYWLKYFARKGNMLMLDEPELNLHALNQRRLARFIVELVNHGIKVFITTHSDTIIREFNILLMLSRNLPHFQQIRERHQYAQNEALDLGKVLLYIVENDNMASDHSQGGLIRSRMVKVRPDPKLGLDVASFDQTILDMSQMQDDLRYGGE